MRIVVIGSRNSGSKNNPELLGRSLAENKHNVNVVYWEDLVFSIATGDVRVKYQGVDIVEYEPDRVIAVGWYKPGKMSLYRDVAYAFALYLHHHQITFWNSEMLHQRSTTKLSCLMQLALEGVPVSATQFCLTANTVLFDLQPPFIVKSVAASRGRSNFFIQTEQDLQDLSVDSDFYLVQPFLPNDHDLRIICFAGEPQMILRRARSHDATTHLNNTSQGGSAAWLALDSVDPQLLTISSKICKVMNREMAGIDFIPDDSSPFGYSCLEVNAVPQLTSGYDTDMKMQAFVRSLETIKEKKS